MSRPKVIDVDGIQAAANVAPPRARLTIGQTRAQMLAAAQLLHDAISMPDPVLEHEPFGAHIRLLTSHMAKLKDIVTVAKLMVRRGEPSDIDFVYALEYAQQLRKQAVDRKERLERSFAAACRLNRWRKRMLANGSSEGDNVRRLFMEVAEERLDRSVFDGLLAEAMRRRDPEAMRRTTEG